MTASRTFYDYSITYNGPIGVERTAEITEWLIANIGPRHRKWDWNSYTILLMHEEDVIALKLKFKI